MSNERIWRMLERMDERLDAMNIILAANTKSLEEHMRRTELLENEIRPIKSHVSLINAGAKILSVVLTLALAAKSLGLFQ